MFSIVSIVLWVVMGAVAFFGFIVIHELGHAGVARLVGVPGDAVAVRLREWPAHVALKGDDQWHTPGTVEYQDAYARHDPELRWLGAFIAAGFVFQTTVMVAVVLGISLAGGDALAFRLVRISMVVNGLYLAGDIIATAFARAPAGDMSSLLRYTPWVGSTTLAFVVVVHVAAASLAA